MKQLILSECLEALKQMEDNSIDSITTDPPYGISFQSEKWDYDVPSTEIWKECLRVLKPGGHLLSFASSRTYHRMAVNIEDAGFEIRDQLMWIYGSGFPKSHNIGKKVVEYNGWGTALKPAHEPIVLARKPLSEKTIVDNVLKWGTGGINVDESRIPYQSEEMDKIDFDRPRVRKSVNEDWILKQAHDYTDPSHKEYNQEGRFPANVLLSEEAAENLDQHTDNTSRYFYVAKPSKKEKTKGLDKNTHPTIKPIKLMDYLVNMITPKGGIVLDPFMGTGTTGISALNNGFSFVGVEMSEEYMDIAVKRIEAHTENQTKLDI